MPGAVERGVAFLDLVLAVVPPGSVVVETGPLCAAGGAAEAHLVRLAAECRYAPGPRAGTGSRMRRWWSSTADATRSTCAVRTPSSPWRSQRARPGGGCCSHC